MIPGSRICKRLMQNFILTLKGTLSPMGLTHSISPISSFFLRNLCIFLLFSSIIHTLICKVMKSNIHLFSACNSKSYVISFNVFNASSSKKRTLQCIPFACGTTKCKKKKAVQQSIVFYQLVS